MHVTEETIDATLDSNGQLQLAQQPRVPAGPVRVTIRVATPMGPRRCLADVLRDIAAGQRSRGFAGRSAAQLQADADEALDEDAERDRTLSDARRGPTPGEP